MFSWESGQFFNWDHDQSNKTTKNWENDIDPFRLAAREEEAGSTTRFGTKRGEQLWRRWRRGFNQHEGEEGRGSEPLKRIRVIWGAV